VESEKVACQMPCGSTAFAVSRKWSWEIEIAPEAKSGAGTIVRATGYGLEYSPMPTPIEMIRDPMRPNIDHVRCIILHAIPHIEYSNIRCPLMPYSHETF
jgi:hypothetical protein